MPLITSHKKKANNFQANAEKYNVRKKNEKKMAKIKRNSGSNFRDVIVTTCFIFLMSVNFYVNVWIDGVSDVNENDKLKITRNYHNISIKQPGDESLAVVDESVTVGQLPAPFIPTTPSPPQVWPSLGNFDDDRILAQLKFAPQSRKLKRWVVETKPLKKILLFHGFKDWDIKPGRQTFLEQKCAVNTCSLTDDRRKMSSADAVLFKQYPAMVRYKRPISQIWIYFMLEPPTLPIDLRPFRNAFNWTATFRRDSDIVTPYEKFVPHTSAIRTQVRDKNFADGKTKKVAWFVSNCKSANLRMEYARELSKYIQVDVYGKCGRKKCNRNNSDQCSEMLNKDYKFYLAFENSNCRDYITEKFFVTGLQHDIVPIVMGAPKEDYLKAAPHNSFIHVDDFASPRALAIYLHLIDQNDHLYNDFFQWKGTGTFINTYFWCRVCAMLHDESRDRKSYDDLERWWRGKGVCIGRSSWKRHSLAPHISDYYSRP